MVALAQQSRVAAGLLFLPRRALFLLAGAVFYSVLVFPLLFELTLISQSSRMFLCRTSFLLISVWALVWHAAYFLAKKLMCDFPLLLLLQGSETFLVSETV